MGKGQSKVADYVCHQHMSTIERRWIVIVFEVLKIVVEANVIPNCGKFQCLTGPSWGGLIVDSTGGPK